MNDDEPTVRPATPADEPRLRAIQSAALSHPWPELLDVAVDGPPRLLVAETTRPVGYALVVPGDGVAYLAEIAVAPTAQGRGIGTRLLDAVLSALADADVATLRCTVRADDERARAFYDDVGFRTVERLPDHYDDGDGLALALDVRS